MLDRPETQTKDIFAGQTSKHAKRMRADVQRVARCPYNILITGETGTGKTEMARQVHRLSARAEAPFIELNCANLPEHLVEAELFGYRKGSFTGADHDRKGLFEEADGGILFLDEIGDIALPVQIRLLKAIDEKQIKRLGANHYQSCDVQIIAATSRNLLKMIHGGTFREDLYCRLAVLTVEAFPLRSRREDIPPMIDRFLSQAANLISEATNQRHGFQIDKEGLSLLCEFDYPGNVRSLRNLVFELTSYVEDREWISVELVQSTLAQLRSRLVGVGPLTSDLQKMFDAVAEPEPYNYPVRIVQPVSEHSFLKSIVREGDVILPLELCILRREETFKQWSARAKRCSIEAVHEATGGSMRSAAARLGLTENSLLGHLHRARQVQNQNLFDWDGPSD
jgi:transcriptional regulator with PAS, ATPase and Fis domain